jgi:hypothetical protein
VKSAQTSIFAVKWQHSANPLTEAALYGIARALESVGTAFICVNSSFTLHHASRQLDSVSGINATTWTNRFDLTQVKRLITYFGLGGTWWNTPR